MTCRSATAFSTVSDSFHWQKVESSSKSPITVENYCLQAWQMNFSRISIKSCVIDNRNNRPMATPFGFERTKKFQVSMATCLLKRNSTPNRESIEASDWTWIYWHFASRSTSTDDNKSHVSIQATILRSVIGNSDFNDCRKPWSGTTAGGNHSAPTANSLNFIAPSGVATAKLLIYFIHFADLIIVNLISSNLNQWREVRRWLRCGVLATECRASKLIFFRKIYQRKIEFHAKNWQAGTFRAIDFTHQAETGGTAGAAGRLGPCEINLNS